MVNGKVFDADGHIMEGPSWIKQFADEKTKAGFRPMDIEKLGGKLAEWMELAESGAHPEEDIPELEQKLFGSGEVKRGFEALGAFNSSERSRMLDLTNIGAQLVFSTFGATAFLGQKDDELFYGGCKAHNRAMSAWCENDPRLNGVALVPLRNLSMAMETAKEAIEGGCDAVNFAAVPVGPNKEMSPGHSDMDSFWRMLEEAQVPFMLHIGVINIPKGYKNNGRPAPVDFNGSGEGVMAKDFPNAHHVCEEFLTSMCFDGVFERFPNLRGGVIEHGANWVPSFVERLDFAAKAWSRSTPELRELKRAPSQQFAEQMRFTPLATENVAELIRQSDDRMYMFNTDYPHTEGGRNPFGRFEQSVAELSAETLEKFYRGNYVDMMGKDRMASLYSEATAAA